MIIIQKIFGIKVLISSTKKMLTKELYEFIPIKGLQWITEFFWCFNFQDLFPVFIRWTPFTKGIREGKLIAVAYSLRRNKTSSVWAVFVNKNRCINVPLVSEEDKASKYDNLDNSHNSFLWPEYFIDFLCERWIPCQASTSVLCLH